ncbi:MAG: phosphate ABC transporter permease subunit PstC [Bacteroidales bacterium]|jgi:phosphate transport system permease protein|nr:phosphate ABC transporter permease subunit PstC [Bacteroidales bacterium]
MKDRIFKITLFLAALLILIIGGGMIYSLTTGAMPAFKEYGFFSFIFSSEWNYTAGSERYGALAFIVGTLLTSFLALAICIVFSIPVSIFTGEYFKGTKVASVLETMIDLLAGIPSIVYGLWGFYMLRPVIMNLGLSKQGFGVLTASIVLAIMIIPYAASLSSQFIKMTPVDLKEGAYSLGATRKEMVTKIVFPTVLPGVISSFILALGRALGETMAVTMLIGNTNTIPLSLGDTGNTMASIIANQFGEASDNRLAVLIAIALLLFIITLITNSIGRMLIRNMKPR